MAEKCSQCQGWLHKGNYEFFSEDARMCLCRSNVGPIKVEENLYDSKAPLTANFVCPNCLCHLVAKVEEK